MSTVSVPGAIVGNTLNISSTANLDGNLQFGGVSGSTNQVLTKTGAATQAWQTPYQSRFLRYVTGFASQDLNAAAGPTAVTFSTTPVYNAVETSRGSITGMSQASATQFTINTSAQYEVSVSGYINPASTGLVSSVVTLSLELNGVELATACVVVNTYSFVGTFPPVQMNAASTVRVLARRVTGTGSLLTFAPALAVPSFQSNISFAIVNTVTP